MGARKLLGLTGPSLFTQECIDVIEDLFDANFVLLYHNGERNLSDWLDRVDGVVLAGGVDIHPSLYEESVWTGCNLTKFDIRRDCREMVIVAHCLKSGKPLLGICRGHQLLGVRFGLTMIMDLANSTVCHQPQRHGVTATKNDPMHSLRLLRPEEFHREFKYAESREQKIFKNVLNHNTRDRLWVNSFHHQGLRYQADEKYEKLGVNVLGVSRADLQDSKEIIELMRGERWLSCQFHPEYDWKEQASSRAVLDKFKEMLDKE